MKIILLQLKMRNISNILFLITLLALTLTLSPSHGQEQNNGDFQLQRACNIKTTCHECIQTRGCAWCLDPNFGDKPRCILPTYKTPLNEGCSEEYQYKPANEFHALISKTLTRGGGAVSLSGGDGIISGVNIEESQSGSHSVKETYEETSGFTQRGGGASSGHTVFGASGSFASSSSHITQIQPQRVSLKLRLNEPYHLDFAYSQAVDYPVDLYYLMDLSKSMEDDKEKLSKLGDLLSDTMRNITSNFQLGFGSFVDKVLMPYVSTVPKNLKSPCDMCAGPYGFRHHMSLNTNTRSFAHEVRQAAVSGNLDAPEGGFDAIMQAVVCRDHIGWRNQARRLLVFSTDAGFHYAGDGKLGGVITPNDGQCHLNHEGLYTHSTVLDYPSISQINQKVKQNSINIIFAVTAQQVGIYEKLSKHVEGSYCATLSEDSSNVVELVKEQYNKISSSIEMKDTASSNIKVTYYSACLKGGQPTATNKCDDLKVGDVVNFTAEIVVTECPPNPRDWIQTFKIYPVGIPEELTVDLTMLCSCPCENRDHFTYEVNSPKCHNGGDFKCGICQCDSLHVGPSCECSQLDIHSELDRNAGCRQGNSTIECSGNGECVCGQCHCNKPKNPEHLIYGKYCECDNFSCPIVNELMCGGPDHGVCDCHVCVCKPGWTGPDCTCRATTDTCKPPRGDELCSGHGKCECGGCICDTIEEGRFSGKYCEKCPTCSGRCSEFRDCVECMMYGTGPMGHDKELCLRNCTLFTPKGVEHVEVNEENGEHKCRFYNENDCLYEFVYNENVFDENGKIYVVATEKLECPPEFHIMGLILALISSIVLIGMALLFMWKLFTTIHDRREFARFEKERRSAKWDTGENPIYKQATSTFKNPTYSGGR